MKAEDFAGLIARMNDVHPENAAETLRNVIRMARRVQPDPQPDLEMLRTAVRLMDQAYDGMVEDTMTHDELLNARAAARANVARFIIEADPMGPEAADQGLAREIAGTEVEVPKESLG
jgi:hypothetical protein